MSLTFNKEILVVSKLKIEDLCICSDFYYNTQLTVDVKLGAHD